MLSFPLWLSQPSPERAQYRNGKEAFLALVGYSIGLGNFWRFPYLCLLHGGVTFFIPYGVFLACVGMPLYLLELTLGQYVGLGPTQLFSYLCPLFSGVGWSMILMLLLISVYYNVILGWSLYYIGASFKAFSTPLPWSHCLDVETEECNQQSVEESLEAAKNYFKHDVLGEPTAGQHPLELHGWLVLCVGVSWFLVAVCLASGVRNTGKILYVTVIYPYVVLICLFTRNYDQMKDEAREMWRRNLFLVEWEKLASLDIWLDAASQVIYSLGVGYGGVTALASYNRVQHNLVRDAFLLCLLDFVTSVFCVFTASIQPELVHDSKDFSPLAFTLFSAMVGRLNSLPWSLLLFFMIFTLGFDSQLLMVEAVTTTLFDQFHVLRWYHVPVVFATCSLLFLLSLFLCTRSSLTVFSLMQEYTAKHSLLLVTLLEVVIAIYFFGFKQILEMMRRDLRLWVPFPLTCYLAITWVVITPLCLLALSVISLYTEDWASCQGSLTFLAGQAVAFAPALLIPIFALYRIYTRGDQSVAQMLKATANFCTREFRFGGRDPLHANEGLPRGISMAHLS